MISTSVDELLRLIGELYVENRLLRAQLGDTAEPPEPPPKEP